MRALPMLLLLVALAGCAPPLVPDSAEACRVERLAALPMRPLENRWVVDVMADGKPATMMLDTGATTMTIGTDAAERLGLRLRPDMRSTVTALGGTVYRRVFEIDRLGLGGETVERQLATEMTAAQTAGLGYDGIIGMRPLAGYDVEIDFPARTFSLYRARFCPSRPPPWPQPFAAFPRSWSAGHSRLNLPMVAGRLDGRRVHALLDTGATTSLVDTATARAVGAPGSAALPGQTGVARTMSDNSVPMWRHRFGELVVAGARIREPELWVVGLGMTADMIVGLDILHRFRIWISNASDTVYIAAPGGIPPQR